MANELVPASPNGQLLIYEDGSLRVQVRIDGKTVWLTQAGIASLFQTTPQNITMHLKSIYEEEELNEKATCKEFLQVQQEGSRSVRRAAKHYNLDAILAVGYRVRSPRGTAFRQWATARLSELLVKGFTMDDDRLAAGRTLGDKYFDELLERIRAIRASERMFYQKITDIYATSIDYDPSAEITQTFFATVQNKLHWAIHGHTAAEVIYHRSDAQKPHMGLTTWKNAPHGLILCQERSRLLAEYSFAGIDKPIGISTYELTRALPKELRTALPTVEEIEAELAEVVKKKPALRSRGRKKGGGE